MDEGAILIDIREAEERARERISGARNPALPKLEMRISQCIAAKLQFPLSLAGRSESLTVLPLRPLNRANGHCRRRPR